MTQSSRRTTLIAPLERSYTNEERAWALSWLFAENKARKERRAALREWLGLSSAGESPPATTTTETPLAAATVPVPAGPASGNFPNPIMGLDTCDRFGKVREILTILGAFQAFSAIDPEKTVKNFQETCQNLQEKLGFVLEYIGSILKPDGKINPLLLTPYRLKDAGIRSPLWKKMMWEMESLMQKDGFSTNYLGQAYDAMSAIDSLMPAAL